MHAMRSKGVGADAKRSTGRETSGGRDRGGHHGREDRDGRDQGKTVKAKRSRSKRARGSKSARSQVIEKRAVRDRADRGARKVGKMNGDARAQEIDKNLQFFLKEMPKLAGQQGKFALLKDRKIVGFYDTPADAVEAGDTLFQDKIFSIQQVITAATDLGYYSHAVPVGSAQ